MKPSGRTAVESISSLSTRGEAERLKIELGSALPLGDEEEFEVADGVDLLSGNPKTILLNSTEDLQSHKREHAGCSRGGQENA